MHSQDDTVSDVSPKPLALLGRDEMNLAEFPIALLTDRVPKDQQEAIYQDDMYDANSGLTLTRKLTITAGNHGLTTALDDEVILSLIQLTKQKNDFTKRRVEFSRHELVQLLGWSVGGASYERIATSLDRWTSVYLKYENAWRDNRTKSWRSAGFHIIERFELNDNRNIADQLDLIPSFIVWNEVIFESFQAGYLKALDYDLCMGLSNSTAKRMYRFLDKRFYHKQDLEFDLKAFAHGHIGLGHNYDGPAHLKRKLKPAITELEAIGFLSPLADFERFPKEGKNWRIRLIQKTPVPAPMLPEFPAESVKPHHSPLMDELVNRGVSTKTAGDLVNDYPIEKIQTKIEVFDWLVARHDKRLAKSPEGYLVKSICDDYKLPKGFVALEERQRQVESQKQAEQADLKKRRNDFRQAVNEKAEQEAALIHWTSLTSEQQAAIEHEALATANPSIRETYELMRLENRGDGLLYRLCLDSIRESLKTKSLPELA